MEIEIDLNVCPLNLPTRSMELGRWYVIRKGNGTRVCMILVKDPEVALFMDGTYSSSEEVYNNYTIIGIPSLIIVGSVGEDYGYFDD